MTSVIRSSFALFSCLLLTAGLVSASQRIDQFCAGKAARSELVKTGGKIIDPAAPCIVPRDRR